MNEKLKQAIQQVYEELSDTPKKEFRKLLIEYKEGDIVKILIEANAACLT